jgi:hypothetical protein
MASKSKTDVTARSSQKGRVQLCKFCHNKVDVVMMVDTSGRKRMVRRCCQSKG